MNTSLYNNAPAPVNGTTAAYTLYQSDPHAVHILTLPVQDTLRLITDLTAERGYCYAHNAFLADTLRQTERTVTRHVAELSRVGLIHCRRVGNDRWIWVTRPDFFSAQKPSKTRRIAGECLPASTIRESESQQQIPPVQPVALVTDALPTPAAPVAAVADGTEKPDIPDTTADVRAFRAWIEAQVPVEEGADGGADTAVASNDASNETSNIASNDVPPPSNAHASKSVHSNGQTSNEIYSKQPELDAALIAALMAEGIDAPAARRLVLWDAGECRRQLAWWGQREARGAGLLIRAIEGRYGVPGGKSGAGGGVGPQGVTTDSGMYEWFNPPQLPVETEEKGRQGGNGFETYRAKRAAALPKPGIYSQTPLG